MILQQKLQVILQNLLRLKVHKKQSALLFLLTIVTLKLLLILMRRCQNHRQHLKWEGVREQKRNQLKNRIQMFSDNHLIKFILSNDLKNKIKNSNVTQLRQLIFSEQVTIKEVLLTFIERTIVHGPKHNWLMDVMFEEALEIAIFQDQLFKGDKSILYKEGNDLFGIPITVKEIFIVQGTDSLSGVAARCFKPYDYDGNQAYMIKAAGGIIFAKTTMSQLGVSIENFNYISGRALSPFDQTRTTGGSSGGQGALIATRCCILGLGTDLGGSIRIPASFNGICGYRPSNKRVCQGGTIRLPAALEGFRNLLPVAGPLGVCVDDLAIMLKVQLNQEHYKNAPSRSRNIYYNPRDFEFSIYKDRPKLRIGVMKHNPLIPACSANVRAVEMACDILRKQGHEIVPFDIDKKHFENMWKLATYFIFSPGNLRPQYQLLEGEKMLPEFWMSQFFEDIPKPFVKIIMAYHKLIGNKRDLLTLHAHSKLSTAYEYQIMSGNYSIVRSQMADQWDQLKIDALISPITATPTLKHGQSSLAIFTIIYAFVWNLLDYSCGVIPITTVAENEQNYQVSDQYCGRDSCIKALEESMIGSMGLPVSVQVITRPLKDELCLSVMKQIEESSNCVIMPINFQ